MLKNKNPELIAAAYDLHQKGALEPNTYVIDMDTLYGNAQQIAGAAHRTGLTVFAMTKQVGRNPVVCSAIKKAGISQFVAVDPWEADKLAEGGFMIGNAGHLVQIPRQMMKQIIGHRPQFITVYSYENAEVVNCFAKELGITQKLLLRIKNTGAVYPGQEGGIAIQQLEAAAEKIKKLPNVSISGVTAFPCILFNSEINQFEFTAAAKDVVSACSILEALGISVEAVNLPSANACASMEMIHTIGGNYIEPGHAFTGTTPAHACSDQPEIPCIAYLTEVSHKDGDFAYVYGGGNYARGNIINAMAGQSKQAFLMSNYSFSFPPDDNIDYYGKLSNGGRLPVGAAVVAAFRTQIFVTRAKVAPIWGIHKGNMRIDGIYTALGSQIL